MDYDTLPPHTPTTPSAASRLRTYGIPRPRGLLPMLCAALAGSFLTYLAQTPSTHTQFLDCDHVVDTSRTSDPPRWSPPPAYVDTTTSLTSETTTTALSTTSEALEKSQGITSDVRVDPLESHATLPSNASIYQGLKGPPRPLYRDNLLDGRKYITAFHDAGWTNQIMMLANMIYIGLQTQRIPILPPFRAVYHLGDAAGSTIAFGEVYNISRLSSHLGIEVLDWMDVKELPKQGMPEEMAKQKQPVIEEVGCWSAWAAVPESKGLSNRAGVIPDILGLDVAWTPAPKSASMGQDSHVLFWPLVSLGFPKGREEALNEVGASVVEAKSGHKSLPDEKLLCYDFLYFMGIQHAYDWDEEWAPQWNVVMRNLHWTDRIESLADKTLAHLFGVPPSSDWTRPPYIAIHARHGDFKSHCDAQTPVNKCFPPLSDVADAISRVREQLKKSRGVEIDETHVVVTSDEESEEWWSEVTARGWIRVDHSSKGLGTAKKYGKWYEVFIDAAIMGKAHGFVGTHGSTMSTVALRRVQDWQDGFGELVQLPGFR